MSADLIAYLKARWAEEEADAHAAFSGQCDPENGWGAERSAASHGWTITPHVGHIHEEVQARHVERWNPARVLADLTAKRAILALHHTEDDSPAQLRNGHWEGYGSNERWIRDRDDECPSCHVLEPCDTVLALTQPYAVRRDFPEEFRG